jgi:L-amino acid N-acyltransferase YncA
VETAEEEIKIRPAMVSDAAGIAEIYDHYVSKTVITFEEEEVAPSEIARRIEEVAAASLPWLVAVRDGRILGYAYATKWRARKAYRFSAEVTVYVPPGFPRRRRGSRLYDQLLPRIQGLGIHVAIGGIALPNDASVALHESFGFSKVAHFEQVGFKFNRWIDVGYWQRKL